MEAGDLSTMEAGDYHARAGDCSTEHLEPVQDSSVSPEGSLKEKALEEEIASEDEKEEKDEEEEQEEEEECTSLQESRAKQQQLLEEFDAAHDEAQRLRVMNLLLQSRVLRFMRHRLKAKGGLSSTTFAASLSSPTGDTAEMAESLEKLLLEAGEVRRQLHEELRRAEVEEEELQQRLDSAHQQVAGKAAQLQQLQEKLMARMRALPVRRQDAERMLKRVWPQLLRLREERLLHTRAKHELESAKQQVAELDVLGRERTVTQYEELLLENAKLAERTEEFSEQLAALRSAAERDLQEEAHLRETLLSTQHSILEARLRNVHANMCLREARQQVVEAKQQRCNSYKKNCKLKEQMELLAHPKLLRDHKEVQRRLKAAQEELDKLRAVYVLQERCIARALELLQQRQSSLRLLEDVRNPSPGRPFIQLHRDAEGRPTLLDA